MSASLSEWVDRLGKTPLPAIPYTLQRVPLLLDRPSTTNADYEQVIGRDPGFALALFRALGASGKQLEGPISSLAHAVSMLGVDAVTRIRKSLPVAETPSKRHDTAALYACYSRAAHAAVYAFHLGSGRSDERPEQMAIAALLNGCGEMALWLHDQPTMEQIRQQMQQGLSRDAAALATLGFTLDQLSHKLAAHWQLPPLTIAALDLPGSFEARPLGVMLAATLARETTDGWYSAAIDELIDLAAEYQSIPFETAIGRCHNWAAEAARHLNDLEMPLSVYGLMYPTDNSVDRVVAKPSILPGRKRVPKTITTEPAPQPAAATAERTPPVTRPAAKAEPQGLPGATVDARRLQEQVILTFKELRSKLGIKQAMFAKLSPNGGELKVKFVIGADKDAPLRDFVIALEGKHLFSLLMKKPQCFWLKPDNRERYLPLIPEPLHPALAMEGFFAVSVFVKRRPLGLIYVDFPTPDGLNQEHYALFRQLGQDLGTSLGSG